MIFSQSETVFYATNMLPEEFQRQLRADSSKQTLHLDEQTASTLNPVLDRKIY
jgi:hypothetical protein